MSGLQSITYQTIIDAVKTYIKTNCINITNFANISNVFKSGYTVTNTIPGGNTAATAYLRIYINGNEISEATTSDVDNDMETYLQQVVTGDILSENINDSEFIKFINDMVVFCTTKLAFSTSIYEVNSKHLIYNTSQSSYDNVELISIGHQDKEINLSDASSIIDDIVNIAKRNIRCFPVIYRYEYVGQAVGNPTITISPTPSDAYVEISSNGNVLKSGNGTQSVSVKYGTPITYSVTSSPNNIVRTVSQEALMTETINVDVTEITINIIPKDYPNYDELEDYNLTLSSNGTSYRIDNNSIIVFYGDRLSYTITKEGYHSLSSSIDITTQRLWGYSHSGNEYNVSASMERDTRKVIFDVTPSDSQIYINDELLNGNVLVVPDETAEVSKERTAVIKHNAYYDQSTQITWSSAYLNNEPEKVISITLSNSVQKTSGENNAVVVPNGAYYATVTGTGGGDWFSDYPDQIKTCKMRVTPGETLYLHVYTDSSTGYKICAMTEQSSLSNQILCLKWKGQSYVNSSRFLSFQTEQLDAHQIYYDMMGNITVIGWENTSEEQKEAHMRYMLNQVGYYQPTPNLKLTFSET